jgi:hypothetical protein
MPGAQLFSHHSDGHDVDRLIRPEGEIEMAKILIAVALLFSVAAPAAAHDFPNVYKTSN